MSRTPEEALRAMYFLGLAALIAGAGIGFWTGWDIASQACGS